MRLSASTASYRPEACSVLKFVVAFALATSICSLDRKGPWIFIMRPTLAERETWGARSGSSCGGPATAASVAACQSACEALWGDALAMGRGAEAAGETWAAALGRSRGGAARWASRRRGARRRCREGCRRLGWSWCSRGGGAPPRACGTPAAWSAPRCSLPPRASPGARAGGTPWSSCLASRWSRGTACGRSSRGGSSGSTSLGRTSG
mmetsp:Transcript_49335/g.152116  ORF Transcript_49335/g.152116 Transcript_49335/m.152116 type:complete len:208 (+) Transcript_49335:451-1074(+)